MVLSTEEKREKKRISSKKWRDKNKEKLAEYREKNKEKFYKYNKDYREKNKEKIGEYHKEYSKEYSKEYRKKNKEKMKEYNKEYAQTPNGKKSMTISIWKHRGLICDDYDLLYSNYLSETHCDECRCRFGIKGDGSGTFKCMDHSRETGLFRNFLCSKCNFARGE